MFEESRPSALRALFILIACLLGPSAPAGESGAPDYLSFGIQAYQRCETYDAKYRAFAAIRNDLESGAITLMSPEDALRLTLFVADVLEHDTHPVLRNKAAEFLSAYPHPAAADALYRVAQLEGHAGWGALEALVSLHDPRALGFLEAGLDERPFSSRIAIQLLGELGSPDALRLLDAIERDSTRTVTERDLARDAAVRVRVYSENGLQLNFSVPPDVVDALRNRGVAIQARIPKRPGADGPAEGSAGNEMYEMYNASYPFVTTDLAFHTCFIVWRAFLDEYEQLVLLPAIEQVAMRLWIGSLRQSSDAPTQQLKQDARRNAALAGTALHLLGSLDEEWAPEDLDLKRIVAEEARRIQEHRSREQSGLFDYQEDYTRYLPRGRFGRLGRDGATDGYFQVLQLFGNQGCRESSDEELRRALLLCDLWHEDPTLRDAWLLADSSVAFFGGPSEDFDFPEIDRLLARVATESGLTGAAMLNPALAVARSPRRLSKFREHLEQAPAPATSSFYPAPAAGVPVVSRERAFFVFPRRLTAHAIVLQELLTRGVWPPSSMSIASALFPSGTPETRADSLAAGDEAQATSISVEGAERVRAVLESANLYGSVVRSARELFRVDPRQHPVFRSPVWQEKQRNTALGTWVELSHLSAPYTKDVMYYMGTSRLEDRFHGYVEPYPLVYAALDSLVHRWIELGDRTGYFRRLDVRTADRLLNADGQDAVDAWRAAQAQGKDSFVGNDEARLAANVPDRRLLLNLSSLLARWGDLAERELRGEPQTAADGFFLKSLQDRLKRICFNRSSSGHANMSMARVIDLATEYASGECWEVAVGRPAVIYVAVPDGDRRVVCRGAVYTFTEFTRPVSARLTDAEWIAVEKSTEAPRPWLSYRPDLWVR